MLIDEIVKNNNLSEVEYLYFAHGVLNLESPNTTFNYLYINSKKYRLIKIGKIPLYGVFGSPLLLRSKYYRFDYEIGFDFEEDLSALDLRRNILLLSDVSCNICQYEINIVWDKNIQDVFNDTIVTEENSEVFKNKKYNKKIMEIRNRLKTDVVAFDFKDKLEEMASRIVSVQLNISDNSNKSFLFLDESFMKGRLLIISEDNVDLFSSGNEKSIYRNNKPFFTATRHQK